MLAIINALLDLWDPYGIYLFPSDEYTSYAIEICQFIEAHQDISSDMLSDFVFDILPPIDNNAEQKTILKVEYNRFSKTLLLILQK